jgi:hypothetical protein
MERMIAAPLRLLWLLAVLLVGAALLATAALIAGHLTSGVPAARVVSADQLRPIARDVAPLVASFEAYRRTKGNYPLKPSDLEGKLPPGVLTDAADDGISFDIGNGAIWVYSRDDDGKGFDLERHLADSAILTLSIDASGKVWTFAASDDEEPKSVSLDP